MTLNLLIACWIMLSLNLSGNDDSLRLMILQSKLQLQRIGWHCYIVLEWKRRNSQCVGRHCLFRHTVFIVFEFWIMFTLFIFDIYINCATCQNNATNNIFVIFSYVNR